MNFTNKSVNLKIKEQSATGYRLHSGCIHMQRYSDCILHASVHANNVSKLGDTLLAGNTLAREMQACANPL